MKNALHFSSTRAKGTLTDSDNLSLSQDGNILPLQTKITSRHHDGSIRHLFVRFEADLPANKGTAIDILPF